MLLRLNWFCCYAGAAAAAAGGGGDMRYNAVSNREESAKQPSCDIFSLSKIFSPGTRNLLPTTCCVIGARLSGWLNTQ